MRGPGFPGAPFGAPQKNPEPVYLTDKQQNPGDTASSVRFAPNNSSMFSCVSWDQKLRLYTINQGQSLSKSMEIQLEGMPLCQTWNAAGSGVYVSLSNNSLVLVDFASQGQQKFATNPHPILYVQLFVGGNFLVCFDSDKNLLVFATANAPGSPPNFTLKLAYQPICGAISGNTLILGCAGSRFGILDLPNISKYTPSDVNLIESNLAAPISSVHLEESNKDFFLGSSDGRVYKGFYTQQSGWSAKPIYTSSHNANDTEKNFTYLAQSRKQNNDKDSPSDLFNINAMGGHPRSKPFLFTTGSDGVLHFWDTKVKNKIAFYNLKGPVNCADVSHDGNFIAFAIGYDWSQGVWGLANVNYEPCVGFKQISDNELTFK